MFNFFKKNKPTIVSTTQENLEPITFYDDTNLLYEYYGKECEVTYKKKDKPNHNSNK